MITVVTILTEVIIVTVRNVATISSILTDV